MPKKFRISQQNHLLKQLKVTGVSVDEVHRNRAQVPVCKYLLALFQKLLIVQIHFAHFLGQKSFANDRQT